MDAFGSREQAFELAFAHDKEIRFKVLARRNAMFSRWVAARLGYVGDTADRYVEKIIGALNCPANDSARAEERAVGRVALDLVTSGWELSPGDLLKVLAECEVEARRSVMTE